MSAQVFIRKQFLVFSDIQGNVRRKSCRNQTSSTVENLDDYKSNLDVASAVNSNSHKPKKKPDTKAKNDKGCSMKAVSQFMNVSTSPKLTLPQEEPGREHGFLVQVIDQ